MSEREDELRQAALKLRMERRMTVRQIAEELGISVGKVSEYTKGIPASGALDEKAEKRPPQFIPMLISKEHVAKLYALAMDEGYDDVNNWLKEKLLPWYAVKRDLEWKLKIKVEPAQFSLVFESLMIDGIELKQLKEQIQNMGGKQPSSTSLVHGSTPTQTDKGEVKPS